MKKTSGVLLTFLMGGVAILSGCSKDPLSKLTPEETQIYITDRDSTINFSSYKTFSISDSVTVINNGQGSKVLTPTDSAYIVAVKKYMQQSGYVLVGATQTPDIAVDVSRIYNTTNVISYVDYGNYFNEYYDPYYYGYGGYGYDIPYAIEYHATEGALSVDLLDLKNAATKKKIDFMWTGVIRGESIFSATNADAQVQALFSQSPYLKTTN
jgi:hypothetical protein